MVRKKSFWQRLWQRPLIPFWKRVVICFGNELWLYHNLNTGEIESHWGPQRHLPLVLIATVTGQFGLAPNPLKFTYYADSNVIPMRLQELDDVIRDEILSRRKEKIS